MLKVGVWHHLALGVMMQKDFNNNIKYNKHEIQQTSEVSEPPCKHGVVGLPRCTNIEVV